MGFQDAHKKCIFYSGYICSVLSIDFKNRTKLGNITNEIVLSGVPVVSFVHLDTYMNIVHMSTQQTINHSFFARKIE